MNTFFAKLTGLILLFLCCILAADIVWKFVPSASATAAIPQQLTQTASRAARPVRSQQAWNLRTLQQANLFGKAASTARKTTRATPKPVQPAAANQSNKPVTRLNLKLTGLVYAVDQSKASALIASGRKQDVYQVSDAILNNVTLESINEDHVVLSNRGRLEILRLSKVDALAKSSGNSSGASAGNLSDADNASLPVPKRLKILRDHIRDNPNKMRVVADKYLRVRANKRNGQIVGYRVYPGRDRRLFNASGLKSGDLVKSINGISIDNPLALAAEAENGTTFNLTVANRRGEERQVTLNLSD